MVAPEVESLMVTDCVLEYVPLPGLKVGAAVGDGIMNEDFVDQVPYRVELRPWTSQ